MIIFNRLKKYFLTHKFIGIVVFLIIIAATYFGYRYFYPSTSQTTYLVSEAKKGTIVTSVSGSGQVGAKSQIDIKSKASGEVVYVGVKAGDHVYAGQLMAQIDSRDAKLSLDSARLSLRKLESSLNSDSSGSAQNYEDALNNINKTFIDLPTVINGLNKVLNNYSVSVYKNNLPNDIARDYLTSAGKNYYEANTAYEKALALYRQMGKTTSDAETLRLLDETYNMIKLASSATKQANTFVSYMYDITDASSRSTDLVNDRTNIGTWIQTIDSDLSSLGNNRNAIKSGSFDLEAQRLTVVQRENEYANYFIRAPFDGIIGKLDVMMSDTISSGSSIGILVTNQKLAEVTLNEVDISKVKVGQKATLTFDAIEDFSLTGTVAEVDSVGTVSSGVVSYGVKVGFDTQDNRVLPGMSVTANIATEVKQDVIVVPNSAIKTTNGVSTVSLAPYNTAVTDDGDNTGITLNGTTTSSVIEIGASDDTNTEIISGLKEGDKVITKTIQSSTSGSASAPSIFSAFGVGNRSGSTRTPTSGSSNSRNSTRSSGGNPAGGPPIGG